MNKEEPRVIYIDREIKKKKFKDWVSNAYNGTKDFVKRNEIIIVPFALSIGTAAVKGIIKGANISKEERVKNAYCYDRSLGHYWKLRRELSNDEWVEVDRRHKAGERIGDILESMKVLK